MVLEEHKASELWGQHCGFLFSYFLSSTVLFLVLNMANKLPEGWNYFHLASIVLLIVLLGKGIQNLIEK